MAEVYFCSDLHFGHTNIGKFRNSFVNSESENRLRIVRDWQSKVTKRDIVYVLGDAAFTEDANETFNQLPGLKYLIRGNHDELPTESYLKYFKQVYGLVKYKEFWLSHAPVHPDELRGKVNLHGHVHYDSIRESFNPVKDVQQKLDRRYLNCCPENLWPLVGSSLISLTEVRKILSGNK